MPAGTASRRRASVSPLSTAPFASIGSDDAVPSRSINSGEMSRIVCAIATRPYGPGVEIDASIRATHRPSRYCTASSSISTSDATVSTASDISVPWAAMAEMYCRPWSSRSTMPCSASSANRITVQPPLTSPMRYPSSTRTSL
ncbi:Uncharacterised protein [Mycobacterium tuberculosis]|nr:Uncharacterised protein [Mycobacterium tuberculosis]